MIQIKIGDPIKLKATPLSPKSGFISFPYDSQLVEYIKSLGNRVYLPESKMWEVPLTAVPTICNKLTTRDIEIVGEMVKETKTQVQLPKDFAFTTQPYNHQLEGLLYGLANDTFLLGDEQGLGKTKQLIDLAIARKHLEGMKHCLIICGVNGNKYNWVDEVHTHSKEDAWVIGTRYTKRAPVKMVEGTSKDKLDDLMNLPPHFFIITNIETLRAMPTKKDNKTVFPIAERIQKLCDMGQIGMVAFDEAHKCLDGDTLISTDLGDIPIRKLVEERIPCLVRSLNEETGEAEFQPVADYFTNFDFEPKIELCVNCNEFERTIQVTASHMLMTRRGWVKAEDIQENDEILFTNCLPCANIK